MTSIIQGKPAATRGLPWWVVILLVAVLANGCGSRNSTQSTGEILAQYLPDDWSYVTTSSTVEGFQSMSIDGDADNEWLLFFHYDSPSGQTSGPIGGIIYDVQQNSDPYNPGVTIPFPYQPMAFFVPYRLLPDWVTGKGQGYLGDTNVTWEPLSVPDTLEQANELLVQGVGANGRVTRVSIFRWGGMTQGYGVSYFQGSYSATIEAGRTVGDVVKQVVTLDALDDRSDLCERTVWTRQGESAVFAASQPSIVFCLGSPPEQPTYPEAVVVAYLLTENSELVLPGSRELVKTAVPVKVNRVVRVAYPGAATVTGTGASAISQMTVETIVDDGLGESRILWSLQELRPTPEEKTTRWRIESAQKG